MLDELNLNPIFPYKTVIMSYGWQGAPADTREIINGETGKDHPVLKVIGGFFTAKVD